MRQHRGIAPPPDRQLDSPKHRLADRQAGCCDPRSLEDTSFRVKICLHGRLVLSRLILSIIGIVSCPGGKRVQVRWASEGQPRLTRFINIKRGSTQFQPATLRQRLQLTQQYRHEPEAVQDQQPSRGELGPPHDQPRQGAGGHRDPGNLLARGPPSERGLIIAHDPASAGL